MTPGSGPRRLLGTALILTLLPAALAACAPSTALPAGVTVSVFQNRFDYGPRQLELEVSNGTDEPITITKAQFVSSRFTGPATWDRPQQVPDGSARDLKVQLTDPACDGTAPSDAVVLEFSLADGRTGTATLVPTDEQHRVDTINAEDCLGVSVAAIAAITAPPEVQWTAGAHAPAVLDIAAVPTGAAGTLTIRSAKGTVLLSLVDAAGLPVHEVALDRVVDAKGQAGAIRLLLVPARCDPHAIEEDKRGTFFPFEVETSDGRSGTIYVPVGDGARASLYEFYSDYCGLP